MSELYMMTTITDRSALPKFIKLYQENAVLVSIIALGHGTARTETESIFLDNAEKAVCFSLVTKETWKSTKKLLKRTLQIDIPGRGIAFTVPLSTIGGRRELAFLTDGQQFERGEESVMKETKRELLVVISNPGYHDQMMDAARDAGAYGGTVIHARGTGMEKAEKFLGISLASEKDLTFIVVSTAKRDRIMQTIMMKAGISTPAGSIVFSLPVSDTAGLLLLDEAEREEEAEKEAAAEAAAVDNTPAEASAADNTPAETAAADNAQAEAT